MIIAKLYDRIIKRPSSLYKYGLGLNRLPRGRSKKVDHPFRDIGHSAVGLKHVIKNYQFESVLDVGSGTGRHSNVFEKFGKTVTRLDYGEGPTFLSGGDANDVILTDFNTFETSKTWDLIWASHILEHQPNVQSFIQKLFSFASDEGYVAVTVPPVKHRVVSGHYTIWNQGLLLMNFALAGFDMKKAEVFRYGGNITLIAPNSPISLPDISYCKGDIDKMLPYLPDGFFEGIDGSRIEVVHQY